MRKSLVENREELSITKQTELLNISRTSIYKKPKKGISDNTIQLMHKIDRIHTDEPTWGYRTITSYLRNAFGIAVNRKRVRRLMRLMGIYAIYPKPNLSKLYHAQYVRPYLLRNMEIVRPDQVWGVDITYIPVERSFIYLFVIIDWYSRYIVDWELYSTLDKGFVLTCLRRALARCKPEIINSGQGSHFTNPDYIALLEESGIRISMDGKGQCLDNARTERFFRTLKYERVYINEYASPREIRQMLMASKGCGLGGMSPSSLTRQLARDGVSCRGPTETIRLRRSPRCSSVSCAICRIKDTLRRRVRVSDLMKQYRHCRRKDIT